jgi:DNA-directed RNA polymerase subunit M/transcription elongation factor TFIIS
MSGGTEKRIIQKFPYYNLSNKDFKNKYGDRDETCKMKTISILYNNSFSNDNSFKSIYDKYDETLLNTINKSLLPIESINSTFKCKKCNQYKIITYEKQTRRADEATTVYKICWNCSFTERA